MWSDITTLVYAWTRVLLFPPLLITLCAVTTAPALGWPAVARWRIGAAWLALVLVPVAGAVRVAEADMLVMLLCVGVASTPGSWIVAGAWWGVALWVAALTCHTLVLDRVHACLVPTSSGDWVRWGIVLGCWVMTILAWPRDTLPQRMSVFVMGLIVAYVAGMPWGRDWVELVLVVSITSTLWVWLRRQPQWYVRQWWPIAVAVLVVMGSLWVWPLVQ